MPKKNRGYFLEWRGDRRVWEIVWFDKGQRRRKSTGTADRDEADKELTNFKEISKRRSLARLVGDALNDYLIEHAPHTSKPEDIARCVLNLLPFFELLSVPEVTKAKCQEYTTLERKREKKTGGKRSDASIRKDLEVLKAALNHDHEEGRSQKNFFVWMPAKPEARDRWLTRSEAASLLWQARYGPPHLKWFIVLSLYSGQRKKAVLNLTWDRVDLEKGKINWQYGKRTNKRRPNQPMSDEIRMFLGLLSRYGTRGFVINFDGRNIADVKKSLSTALKTAKIEGVSSHTLKHTAITWMMQNRTDLWQISGFTGTSAKTIQDTYGHHHPDYLEDARTSHKQARIRRRLSQ